VHTSPPRRLLFGFGKPERVTLRERRLVPFPANVYFDVVLDVDQYHEFVPFCSASRVTRRLGPSQLEADLTIGFRIFTEQYTSRIDYTRPSSIRIKSVQSSVFGHLISTWNFKPDPANDQQCYVEFDVRSGAGALAVSCPELDPMLTVLTRFLLCFFQIDFEVSSPVHASAVKLFFTDVAERQIKAFSDRCIKLYKAGKIKAATTKPTPVSAPTPQPTAVTTSQPVVVSAAPATVAATSHIPFHYPKAISPAGLSPAQLVSSAPSSLTCFVSHLGRRIKFSPSEIDKLRVVFLKHARPVVPTAVEAPFSVQSGPPRSFEHESVHHPGGSESNGSDAPEHLYASNGAELRLDVEGFSGLCTDVCMATGGVFGKFRERATVRTISDVGSAGVLTHALFVGDPHVYSSTLAVTGTGDPHHLDHRPHLPHIEDPEALVDGSSGSATSRPSSVALTSVPHTFGFADFLSHFYYLTKATIEEKLLYMLRISARRMQLYGQDHYDPSQGEGDASLLSPIPDIFRHSSSSSTWSLSVPSLRSSSAAFFCVHLGVLRHIMPLMAYHRAREMRVQIELERRVIEQKQLAQARSPNAALLPPVNVPLSVPVEPGVTALALLGLLEGVLYEAESAVGEAIEQLSELVENRQQSIPPDSAALSETASQQPTVPVEQWVSEWSRQAELLALVSVPGLATMIQIHSVVPLEVRDAAAQSPTYSGLRATSAAALNTSKQNPR
jgi:coenzyme Q-binding protein COQ10